MTSGSVHAPAAGTRRSESARDVEIAYPPLPATEILVWLRGMLNMALEIVELQAEGKVSTYAAAPPEARRILRWVIAEVFDQVQHAVLDRRQDEVSIRLSADPETLRTAVAGFTLLMNFWDSLVEDGRIAKPPPEMRALHDDVIAISIQLLDAAVADRPA